MSGLTLPLCSLILFLVIISVLIFTDRAEGRTRQVPHERIEIPFVSLSVAQAFDPDYAPLWETQVPALQLIARAGQEGLPIERLHAFYAQSARHYPELYDGSSFDAWIDFLRDTQLVSVGLYRVFLMPEGQEFLRYRLTTAAAAAGTAGVAS